MVPSPSTVSTSAPSACTARVRQDRALSPSRRTVHAPHTPCSQPTWVPVRPRSSRRKSARRRRGSTSRSKRVPFTVTRMVLPPAHAARSGAPRAASLPRAPRGGLERPPGEHLDEMAPEIGRGMEVVVGLDRVAGGPRGGPYRLAVRRPAGEERLRGGRSEAACRGRP